MKTTIEDSNTKLENQLKEFSEVVEEEIENQVKEEIKAIEEENLATLRKTQSQTRRRLIRQIEDLETRFRQLSTTETLQQYEADVSRMVNLAYPTAPAEVIEQLSLVRLARHRIISEALVQALEIEAAKEAFRFAINPYQGRDKKMKTTNGNLIDLLLELLQQFKNGQNFGRFKRAHPDLVTSEENRGEVTYFSKPSAIKRG
ncbi:hypothetical protein NQ315_005780 [Exocentrus adspersus]|uniref:Uncharacterized protein n=1 Tax=Exocentrus adspersus TaxID=1586481 RepID=A0AAV8VSB1_9CUCU|nr:hypothetical protein NQ315_005780 [Exocentrus adspersus]